MFWGYWKWEQEGGKKERRGCHNSTLTANEQINFKKGSGGDIFFPGF